MAECPENRTDRLGQITEGLNSTELDLLYKIIEFIAILVLEARSDGKLEGMKEIRELTRKAFAANIFAPSEPVVIRVEEDER